MDTKEKTIFILALIAAGIVGIVLIYFIITIIRQQKRTKQLHLDSMHAEIRTLERERKRVATDLHDDLGPLLSAIKFKITAVEATTTEDKALIEKASRHIDEALARIREISFDLMPNALIRKGLVYTIGELIPKAEKLFPVKIQFRHDVAVGLNQEMVVNLYRVILEIIHNTVKHSRATELQLELKADEKKVSFKSMDNGVGFDLEKTIEATEGLGLKNLYSRAGVMNGEIIIDTKPGSGVLYFLEIPL